MTARRTLAFLLPIALTAICSVASSMDYQNADLLVEPEWLERRLDLKHVRIVDFARGESEYESGHIPGAVYCDMDRITTEVGSVPTMLVHPERVADVLIGLGIREESTVVIYDDEGGLWASRLFWAMEYVGHRDVRLLNGGWSAWLEYGGEVSTERPSYTRGDFAPRIRYELLATRDWILNRLGDQRTALIDVRTPGEYSGEDVRADRGGRIPGAVNVDWRLALTEDGTDLVLPADELLPVFERRAITPDREIATYCQAGVRATHTYFILRLLGYPSVRVYDGSWVEWGNDDSLPIEPASP